MIVEHTFVTTLESDSAFERATTLLTPLRFRAAENFGYAQEWTRGVERAGWTLASIPSRVRLNFDRGRVTVAVSLDAPSGTPGVVKKFVLALPTALEAALSKDQPLDTARAECDLYHRRMMSRDFWTIVVISAVLGVAILATLVLGAIALRV